MFRMSNLKTEPTAGVDIGGGGGVMTLSPQGFDPLPTQRVPPLYYFEVCYSGYGPLKFSNGAFGANIH